LTPRPRRPGLTPGAVAATLLVAGSGSAWAHDGSLGNEIMWQACDSRQIDDPCAFRNDVQDIYRGTCQQMADNLVCVRNQPIEYAATQTHSHDAAVTAPLAKVNNRSRWILAGSALLLGGALLVFELTARRRVGRPRPARRPED